MSHTLTGTGMSRWCTRTRTTLISTTDTRTRSGRSGGPSLTGWTLANDVQRGSQSLRQPNHVANSPEVHEEEPRLFFKHVAVHRRDFNPVRAERA